MADTPVSMSLFITLLLISFIFSIATPAGAGAGIAVVSIIFKTCNVDMTYMALVLSIDTMLDSVSTGLISFETVSGTLLCAGKAQNKAEE